MAFPSGLLPAVPSFARSFKTSLRKPLPKASGWNPPPLRTSAKATRFRLRASEIRRGDLIVPLSTTGKVAVTGSTAAYLRPALTEEYSASMDGIRQDFVIPEKPAGTRELELTLELTGARAGTAAYGAKLILTGTNRELAYSRLRVTDATGRELSARLEASAGDRLTVRVDDTTAIYPVRIDPTFSDADWISMGIYPGISGQVLALAVDGTDIYVGGAFTDVGGLPANYVAKWNGSAWSDGTLDPTFYPNANDTVYSLALQPDGSLMVGWNFIFISDTVRHKIARLTTRTSGTQAKLNADGSYDSSFLPDVNSNFLSLIIQADGKFWWEVISQALEGPLRVF